MAKPTQSAHSIGARELLCRIVHLVGGGVARRACHDVVGLARQRVNGRVAVDGAKLELSADGETAAAPVAGSVGGHGGGGAPGYSGGNGGAPRRVGGGGGVHPAALARSALLQLRGNVQPAPALALLAHELGLIYLEGCSDGVTVVEDEREKT